MFCGFAIRSREIVICYGLGDYKSPGLIGRTFFYDGFQIRRDAWRGMGRLAWCGTPGGGMNDISGEVENFLSSVRRFDGFAIRR